MVAATIKFALETQRLGDVQSEEGDRTAQMSDDDPVHSLSSDEDSTA